MHQQHKAKENGEPEHRVEQYSAEAASKHMVIYSGSNDIVQILLRTIPAISDREGLSVNLAGPTQYADGGIVTMGVHCLPFGTRDRLYEMGSRCRREMVTGVRMGQLLGHAGRRDGMACCRVQSMTCQVVAH